MKESLPPMAEPSEMTTSVVESLFDDAYEKAQGKDGKAIVMAIMELAKLQLRMHSELMRAKRQ